MNGKVCELEWDLMTRTGYQLADLGGRLSSRSLLRFCLMLPPSSKTKRAGSREANEEGSWEDPAMLPGLLATAIDELRYIEYSLAVGFQFKGQHEPPRPIPRPGIDDGVKRVGDGAIPVKDFDDWWNGVIEEDG